MFYLEFEIKFLKRGTLKRAREGDAIHKHSEVGTSLKFKIDFFYYERALIREYLLFNNYFLMGSLIRENVLTPGNTVVILPTITSDSLRYIVHFDTPNANSYIAGLRLLSILR